MVGRVHPGDPACVFRAATAKENAMTAAPRPLRLDFLYLDRSLCARCVATGEALDAALAAAAPALAALGVAVERHDLHVASAADAAWHDLRLSPTVRLDGRDLQPEAARDRCDSCGRLCGCADGVDCRLWRWRGELHAAPPVDLLVDALLRAALGADTEPAPGRADDSVAAFFGAREGCCAPGTPCGCG
jgi:hypothetical protein